MGFAEQEGVSAGPQNAVRRNFLGTISATGAPGVPPAACLHDLTSLTKVQGAPGPRTKCSGVLQRHFRAWLPEHRIKGIAVVPSGLAEAITCLCTAQPSSCLHRGPLWLKMVTTPSVCRLAKSLAASPQSCPCCTVFMGGPGE